MRRSSLNIVILLAILSFSASCGSKITDGEETRALHENEGLVMEYTNEVEWAQSAKVYIAQPWQWDEDRIRDVFMDGKNGKREVRADGPAYLYENDQVKETLQYYDSGREFGLSLEDGGIMGSFAYMRSDKLGSWTLGNYGSICGEGTFYGFNDWEKNSFYEDAGEYDLDFQSFEDAREELENILQEAGVPEVRLDRAYSITKEGVEAYLNYKGEDWIESDLGNAVFTETDEAYFFLYQQIIDGIPVMEEYWMQGLRGPGEAPYTFLYAVKSARDQMELRIYEMMYTVVDEGEEKQLVPYEKALGQIQEKYSSISNAALKYAGLRYAAILMDGEEHRYEMIPVWYFVIWQEKVDSEGKEWTDCEYEMVNAITGEKMEMGL